MYKFLLFLRKNDFFLIFIFLEVISVILIISGNSYQHSRYFNKIEEITGAIHEKQENLKRYLYLKRVNDSLLTENARLQGILAELEFTGKLPGATDSNYQFEFVFLPAHVVYNSVDKKNNFLTINAGKLHGIEPRMGVVSGNGIVGIVKSVSENYATVISVLNSDFKLNAKILETGDVGSIKWDGIFYRNVILTDIPNRVSVKEGSHVVVGPYSRIFPENFPIGTIQRVSLNKGDAFYDIHVRLNNDIKKNTSVYVIKKLGFKEQEQLENEIQP